MTGWHANCMTSWFILSSVDWPPGCHNNDLSSDVMSGAGICLLSWPHIASCFHFTCTGASKETHLFTWATGKGRDYWPSCGLWWLMPVVAALGKLRPKDCMSHVVSSRTAQYTVWDHISNKTKIQKISTQPNQINKTKECQWYSLVGKTVLLCKSANLSTVLEIPGGERELTFRSYPLTSKGMCFSVYKTHTHTQMHIHMQTDTQRDTHINNEHNKNEELKK